MHWYWKIFNFIVGKVFGGLFFIGGVLMTFLFLVSFFDSNSDIYNHSLGEKIFILLMPTLLILVGYLMFKSKSFYRQNK